MMMMMMMMTKKVMMMMMMMMMMLQKVITRLMMMMRMVSSTHLRCGHDPEGVLDVCLALRLLQGLGGQQREVAAEPWGGGHGGG